MPPLTVYLDFGSPYSYLAWARLRSHHDIPPDEIAWKPVSAGHIFKAEGAKPNMAYPNLATYHLEDVRRWAKATDISFVTPTKYPQRTIAAMRVYYGVARSDEDTAMAWMEACFTAHWTQDADLEDQDTLDRLAKALGVPELDAVGRALQGKEALIQATNEAYGAGAPGVPYLVVDGDDGAQHGFWGNDRVEWALAKMRGRPLLA